MSDAGRPYPKNARVHQSLGGSFKAGASYSGAISHTIPVGGDSTTRIRFKASTNGTLSFQWLRPYPSTDAYDDAPVSNVSVTADVQSTIDVPNEGESALKMTWTPSGAGTITYADVCHLAGW